ncbi:transposase [Deinococcus sp.]|uniref:transposase n=1 Tax=Deinococcus sp. TaxID=47478 RepID=UPI0025D06594|nr:transposase [Deinococcus sp.]
MPTTNPRYTAEFKTEAVQLVASSGKSCAEVARDLGLAPHLVVRWKAPQEQQRAAGRPTHTGRGVAALSEPEARLKRLERELEVTRQERDILKKALACLGQNGTCMGGVAPPWGGMASSWVSAHDDSPFTTMGLPASSPKRTDLQLHRAAPS